MSGFFPSLVCEKLLLPRDPQSLSPLSRLFWIENTGTGWSSHASVLLRLFQVSPQFLPPF